jgi:hypothetical protein
MEGRYSKHIKINQGVCQGCSLSPTLFNIYLDDVTREWKTRSNLGIRLKETAALNTLLFADDQIIIQESEDELQKSIFYLNNICKSYNLKISINETKAMTFKGKYPVRTKTGIGDKTLEQVIHFKYLGYDVTFVEETDTDAKIKKFQNICGTIKQTLKGETWKDTQKKLYQIMAVPTLLYGNECWTMRKTDMQKLQAAEMRLLKGMHKTGLN